MNENNTNNLIPEGYYDAVCVRTSDEEGGQAFARFALTKEGDKKQVVADFKILNSPDAPAYPLRWYGFFTKDSAKRTVESLRYMGLKGTDLAAVQTQELDQIVSVKVEHNEWDGKTFARIGFVNAPGGGVVKLAKPMGMDSLRQFAAMMRDSLAKVPEAAGERYEAQTAASPSNGAPAASQGGQASPPPMQEEAPPPMEDDIPF